MPHRAPTRRNAGIKRRIEKIRASSSEVTSTTIQQNVIHTVEDAKTLVRAIITLSLVPLASIDVDIQNVLQWLLHIAPTGTDVLTPTIVEQLDKDVSKLEILRGQLQAMQNVTIAISEGSGTIVIDSKGQRKLTVGDLIKFDHDSLEASNCRLSWTVLLIFKE